MRTKGKADPSILGLRRRTMWGAGVTAILILLGIATVLSLESGTLGRTTATETGSKTEKRSMRDLVTLSSTGETIVVERATGRMRPLNQDEKIRLAEGLRQLISNKADGLVEIHHEDGSVSMDLQGRFQTVAVARRESDGNVTESCLNDLETAAGFFEIDPQLLGLAHATYQRSLRPVAAPDR